MATVAIHRGDAYARQCEAVVTRVADDGVELDRTVFYPLGGGSSQDKRFPLVSCVLTTTY